MTSLQAQDFIASIDGFERLPLQRQTDFLVFFLGEHQKVEATAAKLGQLRIDLRLPPHACSAYLSAGTKARRGKKAKFVKTPKGYALERSAAQILAKNVAIRASAITVTTSLRGHLSKIPAGAVYEYLEEAIACFESCHYRAAMVLGWCVGYAVFREHLFSEHRASFNSATSGWKKPVVISKQEDFEELKERQVIDTARAANLITRGDSKTLIKLLDERNTYAHPTSRIMSVAICEAFLEQISSEVIAKFS